MNSLYQPPTGSHRAHCSSWWKHCLLLVAAALPCGVSHPCLGSLLARSLVATHADNTATPPRSLLSSSHSPPPMRLFRWQRCRLEADTEATILTTVCGQHSKGISGTDLSATDIRRGSPSW